MCKKLYVNGFYAIYGYIYLGKIFGKLYYTGNRDYDDKIDKNVVFPSENFKEYKGK
tara:strand:+ start:58 stop:225 length:168 start_codon:yes stop_codon:yes gene_type:complete